MTVTCLVDVLATLSSVVCLGGVQPDDLSACWTKYHVGIRITRAIAQVSDLS